MKFFLLFIALFLASSCSYFSKKLEMLAENKSTTSTPIAKNNYCSPSESTGKIQYILEDEFSAKFYRNLHPSLFDNKTIPFIKKSIMLSLIEMTKRPDEASPYSRLQVYLKLGGKTYYYDFRPKNLEDDTKMSYLKGLDHLTQTFLPKESLRSIATSLDSIVPSGINVTVAFENFLKTNRNELVKNDNLTNLFYKGDENLTRYETFIRPSYKSIIETYSSPLYSKLSDYEFEKNGLDSNKSQKENFVANCNFDLGVEPTLKDEILGSEARNSHYFGFREDHNVFLAVSSSTLFRPFKTEGKPPFFMKARPAPLPLPVCEFKGKNQDIVLFSSNGRNPMQHLQHLVAYEIDQIDTSFTLNELLNFSRHLFLSNPDRILYESKRGRKAQLDFFLAMNFPIYHVEGLGNIFGHASFKNEKTGHSSLHIDERSSARLWCGQ